MQLQSVDRVAERADEDERVYDRSPRWGRRFGVALILLLLLLIGGFWAWTANGRNELRRQVAAYRAAGEPIEIVDFIVNGVADADNAAIPLGEAAASIDENAEVWKKYQAFPDNFALPLTDKETAAIRAAVEANTAAFDKVDEAMPRKSVDWKIKYTQPVMQTLLPHLSTQRQLARLMVDRARLNYQAGDHAAAIRDLHRAAFIGRTVGHQPMIVSHMVSIGIGAMTAEALAEMSPRLKMGNGANDVRPAEVNELIAQLLDDKPIRASYRRALDGERMMEYDTAQSIADGQLSMAAITGGGVAPGRAPNPVVATASFLVRPLALSDGVLMIRHTTALRDAYVASPDWPTYQAKAPTFPQDIAQANVRHILAKVMMPSLDRATQVSFRIVAEQRMTAIALATRSYARDHGGKLPAKLDELVPKYLPAIPLDPFAAPPQPLKYVNDPDKPLVYSVGDDNIDGGGSELPSPAARNRNQQELARWDKLDAVLHLKLQPRTPPKEPADAPAAGEDPEIYPNEKAIRAAATRQAASSPSTLPANAKSP